jgi:hypothetical protein
MVSGGRMRVNDGMKGGVGGVRDSFEVSLKLDLLAEDDSNVEK